MGWAAGELWEPPAASAANTGTRLRSVTLFRLPSFSLAPILAACSCHGSITGGTTSNGGEKHIPSRRAEGRIPAQQSTAVPPTTPSPPQTRGIPAPEDPTPWDRGGEGGGCAAAPLPAARRRSRSAEPRGGCGGARGRRQGARPPGLPLPPPAPSHREPGGSGGGRSMEGEERPRGASRG